VNTAKTAMPAFYRVFARLFTIQASWNYERMQGIGFGNAAEPALRSLEGGRGGERYRAALARQSHFFNSHPYFAGIAVGAAVRAELDGEKPERIERLRATLGAPLGSLGDRLFWAAWQPVCVVLGLALVYLGLGVWAVAAALVAYNLVHVACRWWALRSGWRHGMTVASALNAPLLRRGTMLATPLAGLAIGFIIPIAFVSHMVGNTRETFLVTAALAVLFVIIARLASTRISGSALAAIVLGATWVAGLLWS
jgi:mannose/fructose/N-acetylgalactosamine-specific phosphotransferase system component IID